MNRKKTEKFFENSKTIIRFGIKRQKKFEHWKLIAFYLLLYDIGAVNFAYFFGLWLRFDLRFSQIPLGYLYSFFKFAPFYTVFAVIIFLTLHLYNTLWRFASFSELNRILAASVITTVFQIIGITAFVKIGRAHV